jgi:hypothetical protein
VRLVLLKPLPCLSVIRSDLSDSTLKVVQGNLEQTEVRVIGRRGIREENDL